MERDKAIRLLRGGEAGINEWNKWCRNRQKAGEEMPDLMGANLEGADLEGANLREASLCGADLSGTNLNGANLEGAELKNANLHEAELHQANLRGAKLREAELIETILTEADLRKANLEGAELSGAYLNKADLSGANLERAELRYAIFEGATLWKVNLKGVELRGANLCGHNLHVANLSGANLSGADLVCTIFTKADLTGAKLIESNLKKANLRETNLNYLQIIECDLSDATVDEARVSKLTMHGLKGLPTPPELLFIDGRELRGEAARTFFTMPAIVEVFLSVQLSQIEIGCYHFHIGEVHASEVATNVFLVGFRYEGDGSVLRFQAKTHTEIYDALPTLLAPFPGAQAVDWKKSLQSISEDERGEAINALVKLETQAPQGCWEFANRLKGMFPNYLKAKFYRIDEGHVGGIRLELFTNEEVRERLKLAAEGLPKHHTGLLPPVQMRGNSKLFLGVEHVGDEIKIEGNNLGNIGSGTQNVRDITQYKNSVNVSNSLDQELKAALIEARTQLEGMDIAPEDKQDIADDLGKLTAEMEKDQPEPSRVRRFYEHIKDIASPVADALSMAASIATLVSLKTLE